VWGGLGGNPLPKGSKDAVLLLHIFFPDRQAFREQLATLAAKTLTKIPALNGRVEKAVKLALAGDVELHDDGTATVYSSSDPTRRYEIRQGTCTCQDYERAPEHLCQHRLAAGLVRKAHELLPPSASVEAETAPAPLPEARASLNFKAMIGAYEVQMTMRDDHEAALLARLQTLLKRQDIRPLPKPVARPRNWKQSNQGRS
jgi:hypothetical protein